MPTLAVVGLTTREIPLANSDHFTIVDERDYSYLTQWQWKLYRGAGSYQYVARWYRGRIIYLHREVFCLHNDYPTHVKHLNGNRLDNQLSNLKGRRYKSKPKRIRSPKLGILTPRQQEIAQLKSLGLSSSEIAQKLYISSATVDSHLSNIYSQWGINNSTELAAIIARQEDKIEIKEKHLLPLPKFTRADLIKLKGQRLEVAQVVTECLDTVIAARNQLTNTRNQLDSLFEDLVRTLQIMKP